MLRPKTSVYLLASMVLAVAALSACSSQYASEENLVRQFFRASGLRDSDRAALRRAIAVFTALKRAPKFTGLIRSKAVPRRRSEPRVTEALLGGRHRLLRFLSRDELDTRICRQADVRRHTAPAALEDNRHHVSGTSLRHRLLHLDSAGRVHAVNRNHHIVLVESRLVDG